jgi:hypothetical protein
VTTLRAALVFAIVVLIDAATTSGAQSKYLVIPLLSKTTSVQTQDMPPPGYSNGDVIFGTSLLRNAVAQFGKPRGAVVGRDEFRVTYKTDDSFTKRVTATLPGGTIVCQGTAYFAEPKQTILVIRGTGAFTKASGTCETSKTSPNRYGADSLNVYRIDIAR